MSITSTLVDRAEICFHEADNALRSFVGCFWVVTAAEGATIRIVPDGTAAISVELRPGQPPEWLLRGPLVRPEARRYPSPAVVIGVRMRPGVAFLVSGIPAHAIVGRQVSLNALPAFRELVHIEPPPDTPIGYVGILQRFLIGRLHGRNLHPTVTSAMREIEGKQGSLRVAGIAARCGVSPRHLNRLMRAWVGYGVKRFAGIVRFQATLHQLDEAPEQSPAALASETGFFDQAHLTTNLSRLAGATPRHLATSAMASFSKTRCVDTP
jgi:AraC-like DNA-binding protein